MAIEPLLATKSARNKRLFYTKIFPRLVQLNMTFNLNDGEDPLAKIEQLLVFADGGTRPAPPVVERAEFEQ